VSNIIKVGIDIHGVIDTFNNAIDLMFDDSPVYLETFHDIDATYLHVINRDRVIYETR